MKMRLKSSIAKYPAEQVVKDSAGQPGGIFWAEHKMRIMRDRLRGDDGIAELYRKEGIAQSL